MANLIVPTDYPTIRAAITAALTEDTIDIDPGTYDIRDTYAVGDLLGPSTFSYTTNINCMTGFEAVTKLNYTGMFGSSQTFITGNPRLFVSNQDGVSPIELAFTGLEFQYNNPSTSTYLMQTGNFGVSEANTITNNFMLDDTRFTGQHAGNAAANGNYGAILGISKFQMSMSHVSLTGQSSFTGTQAISGGSSFLMLQGGVGDPINDPGYISISDTDFNESGFRNGLSIFDSSNVGIFQSKFFRTDQSTRYARSRLVNGKEVINVGNKVANSQGIISGNHFFDGSYLVVEKTVVDPLVQLQINGNHFAQFDPDLTVTPTPPNPIIGGGAVGIVLQGSAANSAIEQSSFQGNTFGYVTPINNLNTKFVSITSSGPNYYTNPITNTNASMQRFIAGGTNGETLNGTNNQAEVFIPGLGSDTVNTGSATGISQSDFVIFNTTPDGSDVDTITNFNRFNQTSASATAAWDRIVLDRKFFPNITAHYASNLTGVAGGIGAVSANNIENNATGVATLASTRLIFQTGATVASGAGRVFYDPDGVGGAPAIHFTTLLRDLTNPVLFGLVGYNGSNLASVNVGII